MFNLIRFFTRKTIAIIVAHPDDETLWAGGTILSHPFCKWFVVCLCRSSDTDRAPRFQKALTFFKVTGIMGDLDDGPYQTPLDENDVEQTILKLLPQKKYDIIITHNPSGEYTKHLRHEEISKAVINLWATGKINTKELRTFAYEDGDKAYFPKAVENASIYRILSKPIWLMKRKVIRIIYGFKVNSWEAQTTPRIEAFWQFKSHSSAIEWLKKGGIL